MRRKPVLPDSIDAFLARWDGTEQAERANYVAFLNELCHVLDMALARAGQRWNLTYRASLGRDIRHAVRTSLVMTPKRQVPIPPIARYFTSR